MFFLHGQNSNQTQALTQKVSECGKIKNYVWVIETKKEENVMNGDFYSVAI